MQDYRSDSHLMDSISNWNSNLSKKVIMKKMKYLTDEQKIKLMDRIILTVLIMLMLGSLIGIGIIYENLNTLEDAIR